MGIFCSNLEIVENVPDEVWKLVNEAQAEALKMIENMECASAENIHTYFGVKDDEFIEEAIGDYADKDNDEKAEDLVNDGYIVIMPDSMADKSKIEDFVTSTVYPFYNQQSTNLNYSFF